VLFQSFFFCGSYDRVVRFMGIKSRRSDRSDRIFDRFVRNSKKVL